MMSILFNLSCSIITFIITITVLILFDNITLSILLNLITFIHCSRIYAKILKTETLESNPANHIFLIISLIPAVILFACAHMHKNRSILSDRIYPEHIHKELLVLGKYMILPLASISIVFLPFFVSQITNNPKIVTLMAQTFLILIAMLYLNYLLIKEKTSIYKVFVSTPYEYFNGKYITENTNKKALKKDNRNTLEYLCFYTILCLLLGMPSLAPLLYIYLPALLIWKKHDNNLSVLKLFPRKKLPTLRYNYFMLCLAISIFFEVTKLYFRIKLHIVAEALILLVPLIWLIVISKKFPLAIIFSIFDPNTIKTNGSVYAYNTWFLAGDNIDNIKFYINVALLFLASGAFLIEGYIYIINPMLFLLKLLFTFSH